MKNIFLAAITALVSATTIAQDFQGVITSKIDYELPEAMEAQRSMLPSEMITYIGKGFSRVEQKTMMGDQIVITNNEDKSAVLLMNMMGKMMAIKMSDNDNSDSVDENTEEPKITYTDETKEIAGYKCKKAVVVTEDESGEEVETEIYYTEEISPKADNKFAGLKGFPLQYTLNTQGMIMTVTASKIEKKKVSKKLSEIPEGYEEMTMEEFQNMMGGGQ